MAYAMTRIVRSLAGHDRGRLYCVLYTEGNDLLLCDGKRRRTTNPKRKKAAHAACLGGFEHPTLEKLRAGQQVSDSEIRKALAAFRAQSRRV